MGIGSFSPRDIAKVKQIIKMKGLWKQMPYLLLWEEVSQQEQYQVARQMACRARQRPQPEEEEEDWLIKNQINGWLQQQDGDDSEGKREVENRGQAGKAKAQIWTPKIKKWVVGDQKNATPSPN